MVPTEKSYNTVYSCEITKLKHSLFKSYKQGSGFQKMGQTPKSRSQGKK